MPSLLLILVAEKLPALLHPSRIASAAAGGVSRPGVCVNVVTASGGPRGDIEMLRSIECHLGCKMGEC